MQILIQRYPSDAQAAGSDHTWSGRPYSVRGCFREFWLKCHPDLQSFLVTKTGAADLEEPQGPGSGHFFGILLCTHEQRPWGSE